MAGTLEAKAEEACINDHGFAVLAAAVNEAPNVPEGYELVYVLTSGENLVIESVFAQAAFVVDEPGRYTIHTLVYNPETLDLGIVEFGVTTGVDVNGLLQQGGGEICGALDVAGAPFDVDICPCEADFGSLMSNDIGCLDAAEANSTVTLSAGVTEAAVVPEGYDLIYVLTSGSDLIIEAVNTAPEFEVSEAGDYTIHTLVYNPMTLDLGIVEFGVTTGVDVNNLLQQGGGEICGALDVAGAPFTVDFCANLACDASAGSLMASTTGVCLPEEGGLTLTADRTGEAAVPAGFELIYVLTSGAELVIENVNAEPAFEVNSTGLFTIHTLVYNPETLDLGIVEFGVTTGVDVFGLLTAGGGDICGALDVAGAPFEVVTCAEFDCGADAGTLEPNGATACLEDRFDRVELEAQVKSQPFVPNGFQVAYVLTKGDGLNILKVSSRPSFEVRTAGSHRIHTLVYDPETLNPFIVQPFQTTGFDINSLLIQGGGTLCGALDVVGAPFQVSSCAPPDAHVYPNPTQGSINVEIPSIFQDREVTISLTDLNGRVLNQWEFGPGTEMATITTGNAPQGNYLIMMEYGSISRELLPITKR